jgi:hypothetical protein
MCNRCPSKANNSVVASLDEAGTAQLQQATELAQLYSLNKCTPDIWQTIINCVEAEGSLSGMLRKLTVPLMHSGQVQGSLRLAVPAHVSSRSR